VDFALAHNLVTGTTLYIKTSIREPGRPPMEIPSTRYILIDAKHRSNLLDVRAFRGANVDSDHYLTASKIPARIASSSRLQKVA
jgi:hypothetical protein